MSPQVISHSAPASTQRSRRLVASLGVAAGSLLVIGIAVSGASPAYAAPHIGLGTARSFAVLAGTTVTNTGPSRLSGNLGLSPGSSVTGFPPGQVRNGTQHVGDAVAQDAQSDLTAAYLKAANAPTDQDLTGTDLGGLTLTPGVYEDTSSMQLTGSVTLDAQGDPKAIFIFKAGSTLTSASAASVVLTNGASPCNVFWQVTSSATLGSGTDFVGTVMALTSVTVQTGTDVSGRILARNGAVTLKTNNVALPGCARPAPSASPTPSPTDTPSSPSTDVPSGTPSSPIVPDGNPPTGLDPASDGQRTALLFVLATLAAGGALLALTQAARPRRRH